MPRMYYQAQTRKLIPYLFAFVGLLSLGACQHSLPSYLVTQGLQQGAIYLHAEDIKTLLSGNELTDKERRYLLISQSVCKYAQNELQMNPKGNLPKVHAPRPRRRNMGGRCGSPGCRQAPFFFLPHYGRSPIQRILQETLSRRICAIFGEKRRSRRSCSPRSRLFLDRLASRSGAINHVLFRTRFY